MTQDKAGAGKDLDAADGTAVDEGKRSAQRPFTPDGGEDEGSAPDGRDDRHLHDDQKPVDQQAANGART